MREIRKIEITLKNLTGCNLVPFSEWSVRVALDHSLFIVCIGLKYACLVISLILLPNCGRFGHTGECRGHSVVVVVVHLRQSQLLALFPNIVKRFFVKRERLDSRDLAKKN